MISPINFLELLNEEIKTNTKTSLKNYFNSMQTKIIYKIIVDIDKFKKSSLINLNNIENTLIQDIKRIKNNNVNNEKQYEDDDEDDEIMFIKLYLKNYYNRFNKILLYVIAELQDFNLNLYNNVDNIVDNFINDISNQDQYSLNSLLYKNIPNIEIKWNLKEIIQDNIGFINNNGCFVFNPSSPSLQEFFTIKRIDWEVNADIKKNILVESYLIDPISIYFNQETPKTLRDNIDDDNYSSIPYFLKYSRNIVD